MWSAGVLVGKADVYIIEHLVGFMFLASVVNTPQVQTPAYLSLNTFVQDSWISFNSRRLTQIACSNNMAIVGISGS